MDVWMWLSILLFFICIIWALRDIGKTPAIARHGIYRAQGFLGIESQQLLQFYCTGFSCRHDQN